MANIKITQLPTATTIGDNDLIPVVTGIGGTPVTEHITKYDFAATIGTSPVETNPVENTYSDIASMLADQSNQTTNYFNYVIDASADPNVLSGDAYYEKLTLSTTTLSTDYRLLSDTEVTIIQDSNSYRVFGIEAIQDDGTPLTTVGGGKISFEYSGTDVTAILFNGIYTDAIAEFYGKDVNVRFYNRNTRKYQTEAVASTAWTTVNTDYYRAEVTGTNIQIADLTVNDRCEFFIVESSSSGSVEGTAVLSTGEVGASKFLREDGDGTCSWQSIPDGGDMLASTYDPATISEQLVGLTATQTLTNKTLTSPVINTSISGTAFLDEDNMASDSATKVPSQQSVKAYVDTEIAAIPVELGFACSDETTDLVAATSVLTFRMPYAMTLTEVRATVGTAPTGSAITVDINETATTILSTKITIDATEKTSETAAVPPVISDSALADDAEITIDIDGVGSTIAGAGLKVWLIGTRT